MPTRQPSPLADYPARRIALIKPSALGDIVHALPVLTALRERYPTAHITWVVNRGYEPLLRGHPDLDATLPFERGASRAGALHGALSFARFLRLLRRQRFDLVIDLQGLLRTGLMALASGAPRRVGLESAREGSRWCYTDSVPDPGGLHAVERYALVARALGATGPLRFRVPLSGSARQWTVATLSGWPRPWLACGVGSRWMTKRWPPEHFAALARWAQARFGGTVVLVGGADEKPLAARTATQLMGPALDLTGATSLPQLAALLSLADVMVANDTGPLHLAVALGRPVVAPYTCTQVRLTGPYGSTGSAVETRVWCAGSLRKRCDRLECMDELTPERLWPVLEEVLRRWEERGRCA
ncbi:MAG: glycosyltransferase family 9 protein [Gemmataceae bacterium]|nr:glycosyltransferase family 9 protein [Gemmataceae bacterium]